MFVSKKLNIQTTFLEPIKTFLLFSFFGKVFLNGLFCFNAQLSQWRWICLQEKSGKFPPLILCKHLQQNSYTPCGQILIFVVFLYSDAGDATKRRKFFTPSLKSLILALDAKWACTLVKMTEKLLWNISLAFCWKKALHNDHNH